MGRFARGLLLVLLAVVVGIFPLLAPTPHRIDHDHFALIQDGMTKAEVEAIFGVPPGEYDWAEQSYAGQTLWTSAVSLMQQGDRQNQAVVRFLLASLETAATETWVSRHGAFSVQFNGDGRVVCTFSGGDTEIVPPWRHWWRQFRSR
jgi:hypothetical protein